MCCSCIRLSSIVQNSSLLPLNWVLAVSQSKCGGSYFHTLYWSMPRWAFTPTSSYNQMPAPLKAIYIFVYSGFYPDPWGRFRLILTRSPCYFYTFDLHVLCPALAFILRRYQTLSFSLFSFNSLFYPPVALQVGLEPTTKRLTVARSTYWATEDVEHVRIELTTYTVQKYRSANWANAPLFIYSPYLRELATLR